MGQVILSFAVYRTPPDRPTCSYHELQSASLATNFLIYILWTKNKSTIMPYAQIAAAPTTRPMPPITAVQRPACPTMAAGVAADLPLITFWCQSLVCYDIQIDEIAHATELAALVALWAPVVAREAAELAPEVA